MPESPMVSPSEGQKSNQLFNIPDARAQSINIWMRKEIVSWWIRTYNICTCWVGVPVFYKLVQLHCTVENLIQANLLSAIFITSRVINHFQTRLGNNINMKAAWSKKHLQNPFSLSWFLINSWIHCNAVWPCCWGGLHNGFQLPTLCRTSHGYCLK